MRVVTIHQAKTNLSRLIKKASRGEEVVIARGSKPVARLVPIGEVKEKRQPGSLKSRRRSRTHAGIPRQPAGQRLVAREKSRRVHAASATTDA